MDSGIIDFRIRPATPSVVAFTDVPAFRALFDWLGGAPPEEDPTETLERMDAVGIELAVVQGRDLETTFDFRVPNEEIAEFVARAPDRLIGLAGIDPNKGKLALKELDRCIVNYGFLGASVDPYMHKLPLDDERMWDLYAYCEANQLIVNITSGPGPAIRGVEIAHASPSRLDTVANAFPDLTIVMSHGGYPWVTEMIAMAIRHPQVFFEASVYEEMPGADAYRVAAGGILSAKMLFASAHPYKAFEERLEIYRAWDLDEEAYVNVMRNNAAGILERAQAARR